jgi:hypothetical protein
LASAELVTIKQLMMPSEMHSAIACLNKLCTIMGRTSVNSPDSPAPARSASAASCNAAAGAGARRNTSPAQRLIVRSSCDAVFCTVRAGPEGEMMVVSNDDDQRQGGAFAGVGWGGVKNRVP